MQITNKLLDTAYDLIDQRKIERLSIDIFDTLLFRKVPYPIDIFLMLGRIFKEEGWLADVLPAEAFTELRVKAEQIARYKKGLERGWQANEVTLEEIYWNLSGVFKIITLDEFLLDKKGLLNESDISAAMDKEVELEVKMSFFNQSVVDLIFYANKQNIPVILVTNTYLSHSSIQKILEKNIQNKPFLPCIDKIFVSCEYGYSKANGLFEKILSELSINPDKLLHIGDDKNQDILPASKLGIKSLHLPKGTSDFKNINKEEWPSKSQKRRAELLDHEQGDFGLTALRAAIAFQKTDKKLSSKEQFFWRYGATYMGPIFTGFTRWLYARCKQLKETQVFCLMREGRLYRQLIELHAPFFPDTPIKAEELWISRNFIISACIIFGTEDEIFLASKHTRSSPFSVASFCLYLGVDIKKSSFLEKHQHCLLDNETFRKKISRYLASRQRYREKILQKSTEKRKQLLAHLEKLIDLKTIKKLVVVDIGWIGTIQGCLQTVLQIEGYSISVYGLYLATVGGEIALLTGQQREGYLMQLGYPEEDSYRIRDGLFIFEEVATSGLGQVVGFSSQGEPICHAKVSNKRQQREAALIKDGIFSFSKYLQDYIDNQSIEWDATSPCIKLQLMKMMLRNNAFPTKQEATKFGPWRFDDTSSKFSTDKDLCDDPYYEKHCADMFPNGLFHDYQMLWPFAYAAKKDKNLLLAAQAVKNEELPMQSFLSLDSIPLHLYFENGQPFSMRPNKRFEIRSNANRAFFLHTKLSPKKQWIRKIKIEIPFQGLIRVKSLRLILNHVDGSESCANYFEEKNGLEGLECSLPEIELGVFFCKNKPLSLVFNCASEVVQAQINLCFEAFKLSTP